MPACVDKQFNTSLFALSTTYRKNLKKLVILKALAGVLNLLLGELLLAVDAIKELLERLLVGGKGVLLEGVVLGEELVAGDALTGDLVELVGALHMGAGLEAVGDVMGVEDVIFLEQTARDEIVGDKRVDAVGAITELTAEIGGIGVDITLVGSLGVVDLHDVGNLFLIHSSRLPGSSPLRHYDKEYYSQPIASSIAGSKTNRFTQKPRNSPKTAARPAPRATPRATKKRDVTKHLHGTIDMYVILLRQHAFSTVISVC